MADEHTDASAKSQNVGKSNPAASNPNGSQQRLLAALAATDGTVHRLDKLISSAAGEERLFAITGYLSHALHHLLASSPSIALQSRLSLLARLRQSQHKGSASPPFPAPAPTQSKLLALSALMSETRYSLRLLGLIPLWTWGSQTIRNPPKDPVLRVLAFLQVFVNIIYQGLENVGYLASKGVISKKFINKYGGVAKFDLWSTRAWFGHIFFQFFVLYRQHILRRRVQNELGFSEKSEARTAAAKAEVRAWRKSLVNNVFWAPLCLHWSVEKGIGIPGSLAGVISFMAGAWGFWDIWAATA